MKKLNKQDLINNTFSGLENLNSTADYEFTEKLIGQEKGISSIKFGLNVKDFGYNIYIAGDMGTGKTTSAKLLAQEISKNEIAPPDFVYVFNFEDQKKPLLIELPKSVGTQLKDDLEEVIGLLLEDTPKVFADKKLISKKNELLKQFEDDKELLLKELSEDILKDSFALKHSATGVYVMPMKDNEVISEEDFELLSEEEKEAIRENSITTNLKVENTIELVKNKEKELVKKVDEIDYAETLFIVGKHFTKLITKYEKLENEKLNKYLEDMKEDILENIQEFLPVDQLSEENLQEMLLAPKNAETEILTKYSVNVFVDNKEENHAKVVVVDNPTYSNLFGEIDCENEGNNITTNFKKIKSGALQQAYGGYIIINCYDLLTNVGCYEKLRNVLKTRKITVDAQTQVNNAISYSLINPEEMDFNSKIILVGSNENYYNISNFDDDFRKYFKVFSDFDNEMDYTENNCLEIMNFICGFVKKNNAIHFDIDAVKEIIKLSQKYSGSKLTLNTNFNLLTEVLTEATLYAKEVDEKLISVSSLKKAIDERIGRVNTYEEKMIKMIDDELIMIDTKGEEVGQINGLCVISTYDYSFGMPTKITATTYIGSEGVINIEKEAEMSGNIHEKGVGVLSGYLGEKYSQDFPLCLSARICFEQNYSGVDGDSASSTELYAVLSSLSNLPIKQYIAVTGSINQKGYIQAIGGVSEKIEGFFKLCKKRGLTGKEGVIIPSKNVNDLVLNDEVVEAISNDLFSIYAIDTIDEGIEILTGTKMGELVNGEYEKGTINYLVYDKLKGYYTKLNEFKRKG